jgi:hypothetical protein
MKDYSHFWKLVEQYPYVYAWGMAMGSYRYYIEGEIEKAIKEKAPKNAIYRRAEGVWETSDDLSVGQLDQLEDYIKNKRLPYDG